MPPEIVARIDGTTLPAAGPVVPELIVRDRRSRAAACSPGPM
ncbi:hypothetical protein [Micromonospora marina]